MQQSENNTQRFFKMHLEFVEECKQINSEMRALYAMPHKFIEKNASAIDQYLEEAKIPGAPESFNRTLHGVREFVNPLEDFKYQTMQLFFEHRAHTDKCADYLQKSQELRAKSLDNSIDLSNGNDSLMDELSALRVGLNCIREKAGAMTSQLGDIEGKWSVITKQD